MTQQPKQYDRDQWLYLVVLACHRYKTRVYTVTPYPGTLRVLELATGNSRRKCLKMMRTAHRMGLIRPSDADEPGHGMIRKSLNFAFTTAKGERFLSSWYGVSASQLPKL